MEIQRWRGFRRSWIRGHAAGVTESTRIITVWALSAFRHAIRFWNVAFNRTDFPLRSRSMRATYTYEFQPESRSWRILSRSGHVVYESSDGEYVRTICRELCT